MFESHYPALVGAYAIGLSGWLLANRVMPRVWPKHQEPISLARPKSELGFALLGILGVLAVGQLWMRGVRLPEEGGFGPILAAVNQVMIFAPLLLVLVIRRQSWTTAWLPRGQLLPRLLTGALLSALAVTAYSLLRDGSADPWVILGRIWRFDHVDEMTQVLLEDLAIAILFVRLVGSIGVRWSTIVVATLFAAGHIPTMITEGATLSEFAGLLRDVGIGVAAILILQRSRDIVWFWLIHFSLDMTQFSRVNGLG